jgi:hypothetical protein
VDVTKHIGCSVFALVVIESETCAFRRRVGHKCEQGLLDSCLRFGGIRSLRGSSSVRLGEVVRGCLPLVIANTCLMMQLFQFMVSVNCCASGVERATPCWDCGDAIRDGNQRNPVRTDNLGE